MQSANQRWKQSGTNLSFKNWIDLENKRQKNFYKFDAVTTTVQQSIQDSLNASKDAIKTTVGYKSTPSTDILGLNRNVFIFSTGVIVISVAYLLVKKYKK